MGIWPWRRRRGAALVDFDNVGSDALADAPSVWIEWLEDGGSDGKIWRCAITERYMYWNDPGGPRARQVIERFTRAGFTFESTRSIVEGKSASDTVMGYDIGRLVSARPRIDDFFVFSTDTDFMPLVKKLIEAGRRVTVLTRPETAAGYKYAASRAIDEADVLEAVKQRQRDEAQRRAKGESQKARKEIAAIASEVVAFMREQGVDRLGVAELSHFLRRTRSEFKAEGAAHERWLGYGSHHALMDALCQAHADLKLGEPQRDRYSLILSS